MSGMVNTGKVNVKKAATRTQREMNRLGIGKKVAAVKPKPKPSLARSGGMSADALTNFFNKM